MFFFRAALICLQRRSSSTKPIYSVKSSLFTVCICSSNTIEGFVRPKSSPKIMWDGKYLFFYYTRYGRNNNSRRIRIEIVCLNYQHRSYARLDRADSCAEIVGKYIPTPDFFVSFILCITLCSLSFESAFHIRNRNTPSLIWTKG